MQARLFIVSITSKLVENDLPYFGHPRFNIEFLAYPDACRPRHSPTHFRMSQEVRNGFGHFARGAGFDDNPIML